LFFQSEKIKKEKKKQKIYTLVTNFPLVTKYFASPSKTAYALSSARESSATESSF